MLKFNRLNFLLIVLISHMALGYVLIFGSLSQILATILLFIIECSFCSTAVYHRLISHRSWTAPRFIEIIGTLGGIFTFTGTPITRTLSHRYHHKYADTQLDPHSPKVMGMFMTYFPMLVKNRKMSLKLVPDLLHDPLYKFCHANYFYIIILTFTGFYLLFGLQWAVALVLAPGALTWMNISICNIFCHSGKNELIVNNKFLALITFGEGMHKNHHEHPDSPRFGSRQYDLGHFWIRLFQK